MLDLILVPQGPEFQAVKRGIGPKLSMSPKLLSLPVGPKSVTQYLEQWQQKQDFSTHKPSTLLVMGLCGSLSSKYQPGDVVIYSECVSFNGSELLEQKCNDVLTTTLQNCLQSKASLVRGLTSDRLIYKAQEKQRFQKDIGAEVVDMEGFAVLNFFAGKATSVAMVRVVSDDFYHDIPNLTSALTPSGNLQPLPLAIAMFREPVAAFKLIRGALKGLKVLEQVISVIS
ncbi:MAG: phosphorylase [Microcoleaceae cyanobacterium]